MRRQPDTGESSASINRRADDASWARVLPDLQAGATLVRAARLNRFYVDHGDGPRNGGFTPAYIRRLERAGILKHVGVDRYALAQPKGGAA